MVKKIILFISFVLLLLNTNAQGCYTFQRDIKSYEDWYCLLDSLFQEAMVDSTDAAYALLVLKVDSLGFVMSVHIRSSRNMDSNFFYKICSVLEDCYSYSFIFKENQYVTADYKKYISKDYLYLEYLYSIHP